MCGLFGVINFSEKHINKPLINVLGIANDSRGGDSCGLFIDGEVEYGIDKTSKYWDFMDSSNLLESKKSARIILGHCRKASVGGITLDKAQPCIHRTEDGKIDFVVLHNGTIKNHAELAKKYIPEVNTALLSDSQIMTEIFYNCGYNVLKEYIGGSVFVITDYRFGEPKTMVFQGVSKEHYNDKEPKDERPFFYTNIGSSYVFSSIWCFLSAFAPGKEHKCYCVPANTLVELDKDCIRTVEVYDRSSMCQNAAVYGYSGYGNSYGNPTQATKGQTNGGTTGFSMTTSTSNGNTNVGFTNVVLMPASPDRISYNYIRDAYVHDSILAHGAYELGVTGSIGGYDPTTYYFWEGVILRNKKCYEFLTSLMAVKNMTSSQLLQTYPHLVHYLSPYPWKSATETYYDMMISCNYWNSSPFHGDVARIFDLYKRTYKSGKQCGNEVFVGFLETKQMFAESPAVDFTRIEEVYLKQ